MAKTIVQALQHGLSRGDMQNKDTLFSTTIGINIFESLINQRKQHGLWFVKDSKRFTQVVVEKGEPPFCITLSSIEKKLYVCSICAQLTKKIYSTYTVFVRSF